MDSLGYLPFGCTCAKVDQAKPVLKPQDDSVEVDQLDIQTPDDKDLFGSNEVNLANQDHQNEKPQLRSRSGKEEVRKTHNFD